VTVYLDERAQRKGIGKALYVALFELLRRQGYVKAFAGITLPNPASVGLHEAMGFTRVGVFSGIGFKFGQWHDVLWLEMQLRQDSNPITPLAISEVLADPTLEAFLQNARSRRCLPDYIAITKSPERWVNCFKRNCAYFAAIATGLGAFCKGSELFHNRISAIGISPVSSGHRLIWTPGCGAATLRHAGPEVQRICSASTFLRAALQQLQHGEDTQG
jgi:hypothetical protein